MLLLLFISTLSVFKASATVDSAYTLQTERLPTDLNFMPTLGNGQLGYTVFGDAIYMNGVYNGHAGDSRRARIPNWLNLSVISVERTSSHGAALHAERTTYELNLSDGYFRWQQLYDAASVGLIVEQRTYAHRYYNRALVYELLLQRKVANESLTLKLAQMPGDDSAAFDFTPVNADADADAAGVRVLKGVTKVVEHELFQKERRSIYVAFSECLEQGKTLVIPVGEKGLHYRFILTADEDLAVARQELNDILALKHEDILPRHAAEWQAFWQNFSIEIKDNLELSQTINAGIFYLASALPALNTHQPNHAYFGLSPTGLGRGQLDDDYEGHNFWDTEIWMLPVVTQLAPAWAQALLQYRLKHLRGAQYNANVTGYKGARFPWESAYSGTEVINPCCTEIAAQEVHISPDIVFAVQQFYATTNARAWLCETAWPLVREIATFLESRVAWNAKTQKYQISGVMGPDEDHGNVNDNVYTNVVFKLAFEFASFTQNNCAANETKNANWHEIAQKLLIVYDSLLDYHPQHLGYKRGTQVKQADTILLGYPLQFAMNASTRLNDLNAYASATRVNGPAMTWSMFAINFLDVNAQTRADAYFEKAYKDYVQPEFKVWSETNLNLESGAVNFLTGIGGFLQAILNGYAGIRFYNDGARSIMELKKVHLLPASKELTIKGIKFANAKFTLHLSGHRLAILGCTELGSTALKLSRDGDELPVFKGLKLELGDDIIRIQTL